MLRCPMPSSSPMVVVLAAVAGALAAWVGVMVMVVMALWNKLDKRFDDLETRQAKRTDELRADIKELRTDNKALGEKIGRLVEIFATAKPA